MNTTPHIRPSNTLLAVALAGACALAPAAAQAKPVDMASPAAPRQAQTAQDLRSPDSRDASKPVVVDKRSPDARDAAKPAPFSYRDARALDVDGRPSVDAALATERSYSSYGDPKPITSVEPGTPASSDFDWPSAGIGAGIAMVLALVLAGVALTTRRRTGGTAMPS